MWPFRKNQQRRPGFVARPDIVFLSEQDGPGERDFKAALVPILKDRPEIVHGSEPPVVLCVRSRIGEDATLLQRSAATFHKMFSVETALDILFLDAAKEEEVGRVCRPFYVRTPSPPK